MVFLLTILTFSDPSLQISTLNIYNTLIAYGHLKMNMDLITIINGLIIIVFALYVNYNENKIWYDLFHPQLLHLMRMHYLIRNSIIDYNNIRLVIFIISYYVYSRNHNNEINFDICIGVGQYWHVAYVYRYLCLQYYLNILQFPDLITCFYTIVLYQMLQL